MPRARPLLALTVLVAACGSSTPPPAPALVLLEAAPEATTENVPPACSATDLVVPGAAFFTDISDASGIRAENFTPSPSPAIPINDHSRLGFVDLDGDGREDIVTHSLYPNAQAGIPFEHLIYRNRGDGTFENVSDASGLRDVQAGFFAFGDVDNDGDQDCFAGLDVPLTGRTHQVLLNDGAGHFTRRDASGVEGLASIAANAVFADFDGDARLDLFVGMGGTAYSGVDVLLIGNGDASFRAEPTFLGGATSQPSNGSVACDYDDDGDLDIFVSTYGVSVNKGQNLLFENDGTGAFHNVATARGFASLGTGNYWLAETGHGTDLENARTPVGSNGFGLDCADITGDGRLDIFLTAISHPVASDYSRMWSDPSQLLVNHDNDFVNEFQERGLPFNEGDVDGAAVDFDNDGRLDLSVSRDRKYEGSYPSLEQKSWFGLMHQLADGTFDSVGYEIGINDPAGALLRMKGAQNHAWADVDADGDMDLLVGGRDQGGGRANFLFRNDLGSKNAWLSLRVKGDGTHVNRDGIGTRVSVVFPSGQRLVREVRSSRGMYNSMDGRALHFGLGGLGCDFEVRVRWPDRREVTLRGLQVRKQVTLRYPDQVE